MIKELWLNLPVKDVQLSRTFYTRIGFTLNTKYGNNENAASFLIGQKHIVLMLFHETAFQGMVRTLPTDSRKSSEVLISIDAESKEEVDEMTRKVIQAGGYVFAAPEENMGWLYGSGFADPDGHRWNILFMDISKMPQPK